MRKTTESDIENVALEWLAGMGYTILHGPSIAPGELMAERSDYDIVVLTGRLREALLNINPDLPESAIDEAIRAVCRIESPSLIENNRRFHRFLTDGVDVSYRKDDREAHAKVWLLDLDDLANNDFLAVNQFTVVENRKTRRPDVVVFVNGLPVAVIELKNPADENATIRHAFNQLQTYKADIPTLFAFNEILLISDGLEARMGTVTSGWDRFMPWRTIDGKDVAPKGSVDLEVLLKGTFEKRRLLDLILNFVVFEDDGATVIKKLAAYHQFHAVNKALECTFSACGIEYDSQKLIGRFPAFKPKKPGMVREDRPPYGPGSDHFGGQRIGVVWHTQGSGKSLSMTFYAGKVMRHPGMENPTLVIITDRNDLDDQLFGTFSRCSDLLRQWPVQAGNREDLRELLRRPSGGVIFTTIQKFLPPDLPQPSPPSPLPAGEGRKGQHYRGGLKFSGLLKRARELRQNQTTAEDLMWKLLRGRRLIGQKFRRQHQIGEYVVDFYCAEARLVVEADGAVHAEQGHQEADRKRDAYLRALGNRVLRFSNSQIINETASVLESIADELPSPAGRGAGGEGVACLSDDEVAFYDALEVNDSAVKVLGDECLRKIAQELVTAVRRSVTIDWTVRENARAKIRVMVKRILRKYGYPPDKQEKATQTVLEQAEVLCQDWMGSE